MTDNERKELLPKAKPILFNTEMVRAILDGRKTVTRRAVKFLGKRNPNWTGYVKDGSYLYNGTNEICNKKPPDKVGDILYVRETWSPVRVKPKRYLYKTHCPEADNLPVKWHPSIHMPKEAARIFLRVTNVRVERLQTVEQIEREGIYRNKDFNNWYTVGDGNHSSVPKLCFRRLWDSTIKKSDLDKYGWAANPWVWVIEFERID